MAALLVTMSVMTIMLSVAMPTWSHMIRREREEELIFRGEQYARAINSYQRKYANQSPANLDVLIKERMLRKKFRDPLSPNKDGEFQLLYFQTGTGTQGGGTQGAGAQGTGRSGSGSQGTGSRGTGAGGSGQSGSIGPSSGMGRGAVVGVVSKNAGQSIRTYKGRNRYSEWQFIGMELSQRAGGPGGAAGGRGGPGGRSGTQGGRGGPTGTDRGGRGSGTVDTTPDGGTTFTPRGGSSSGPR